MRELIVAVLQIYVLAIIARIIISWVAPNPEPGPMLTVVRFIDTITEPVLGPVRRALPPVRIGMAALDLSPMLVIIVIQAIVIPIVA